MEVKGEVKGTIPEQIANFQSYRPASPAGLTSCAKRITSYVTSFYNFQNYN